MTWSTKGSLTKEQILQGIGGEGEDAHLTELDKIFHELMHGEHSLADAPGGKKKIVWTKPDPGHNPEAMAAIREQKVAVIRAASNAPKKAIISWEGSGQLDEEGIGGTALSITVAPRSAAK